MAKDWLIIQISSGSDISRMLGSLVHLSCCGIAKGLDWGRMAAEQDTEKLAQIFAAAIKAANCEKQVLSLLTSSQQQTED